jgi:diacylglycerol kinase (ATP)
VPDLETVAVVHGGKLGLADAADRLAAWAHRAGLPAPHVVATTVTSPGTEQARAAVAAGADLVLAWGGDGTVRRVAAGLAGTDVPLGIIAGGTGNLLARNLGLPLDAEAAATVALTGVDRRIDVLDVGLGGRTTVGTVIAGIGLDAALIDAPQPLKDALGPSAYVLNAARALRQRSMRVGVAVDGGPPQWFHARTVLVANVGGLIAGLDVVPEADPSDGALHVVVLPLSRPSDWVRTGWRLVRRSSATDASRTHLRGTTAWIVARTDEPRQVDGDLVEDGHVLQVRVRPGALLVRVPQAVR